MGARGPQAAVTSLTVVGRNDIETIRRPDPPDDIDDEMAEEWRKVVSRMPADWFPTETLPLLVQYCTHIIRARRLREAIAGVESREPFSYSEYRLLSSLEERQSRAIASLATRMRLSQQATYDPQKRKGPRTTPRSKPLWAGAEDN